MLLFKCNIFLKFLFLVLIDLVCAHIKISDKRLCVDHKCEVSISEGNTLTRYSSPDKNILSFGPNEKVTIFSKSAGSNPTLWGVEINGKRGYIPQDRIRERKVFNKPKILVDTEFISDSPTIEVPSEGPKQTETVLSPEPVKRSYEVIDGTKVPADVAAFSEEDSSAKLNDNSLNSVETDKKKSSGEIELEDSKLNREKDTNEIPSGIISKAVNFLISSYDKNKEALDVVNNEENEQKEEDYDDDDDDDDDDDSEDDNNEDGETEEDNEEIDSKEKNSETKSELEISDKKSSSSIGRNLLQFNEKSEELSDNLSNSNNFTGANSNTLDSENQELTEEEKYNESINNSLNITSSETVEAKEQHEGKIEQKAQSVVDVDPVQQSTENTDKKLNNEEIKVGNTEIQLDVDSNLLKSNEKYLESKIDNFENLERIITQKNYTEEFSVDLSNSNSFTGANLNTVNSENKELTKEGKDNESKNKLKISPTKNIEDKEQHEGMIKQQAESVDDLDSVKINRLQQSTIDLEKISEVDVNNNSDEKKNSIGNEDINKKLIKDEELNVENTNIKSDEDLNLIGRVNTEYLESSEQKLPLEVQTDENLLKQLPIFENYYSKNNAIAPEYNNSAEETVELKNIVKDNVINETFHSKKIQKGNSGGKPLELKENQQIETLINVNSNIELQNVSETSSQIIQENLTQNTQEGLTQNVQEKLIQNTNEKSSHEILNTDNNKNNNLNADSSYKDLKSESNNVPGSISIHSGHEEQDENENLNQKISNQIYQSLHQNTLLIHKNKDNQLSERTASSATGTEQGNDYCLKSENVEDCALDKRDSVSGNDFFQETIMEFLLNLPNDVVSTVLITALTTILFLLGYIYIDKSNRIRPLIAKINKLEKALLLANEENKIVKEKLLQEENDIHVKVNDSVSSDILDSLQKELEDAVNAKTLLEEQIVNLERELENSTEVGLELNRMLSDFLSSQDSDVLVANIEQLQRQLVEQQGTINSYSETVNVKETEIHELRLELEISNSKVSDLQKENERATTNLLKIEEEKYELQNKLESEVTALKKHIEQLTVSSTAQINKLSDELKVVQKKAEECQRNTELKTKEYNILKENTMKLKTLNDEDISSLLSVATFKAELELLSKEKHLLLEHCKQSDEVKDSIEKQYQKILNEMQTLQRRYDEADREKLEAQTKLEVLENYFKEREANLQKELAKHEAMFMEKQGETYSITEKIKFMQEELQNYKAQNESLKQEIMEQEVQMKSQISLLEKRVHENWVNARQSERRLEEAKQEAAQLRNRLTIRERTLQEEKYQNRLKSPSEQNGELPVSPTPASPPLIFGARDLTTSPPLQGLPPPFLPPPPFMPPPIPGGVPPPFMPPPSSMPPLQAMFPSDRRPAPLGRMSSPPIDSRYSPDSRAYSPYSRNSPSPTSDDDYCHSPPPLHRGYSPINNRESKREYRRSHGANKITRNHKGSMHSSGSANSNESLEKIARKPSKV